MDWKTVRQCEYKGWTIIDNGYGFKAYGPNGGWLWTRYYIDQLISEIDKREGNNS